MPLFNSKLNTQHSKLFPPHQISRSSFGSRVTGHDSRPTPLTFLLSTLYLPPFARSLFLSKISNSSHHTSRQTKSVLSLFEFCTSIRNTLYAIRYTQATIHDHTSRPLSSHPLAQPTPTQPSLFLSKISCYRIRLLCPVSDGAGTSHESRTTSNASRLSPPTATQN